MIKTFILAADYLKAVKNFSSNAKGYLWANFLVGASFSFNGVIFNLYLAEAGLREGFIGSMLSLSGLGLVIFALPSGWLSDRLGRKKAMFLGLAVGSLVLLFRSLIVERAALLVLGFIGGAAGIIYQISAAPFMVENSRPEERTLLFSMSFAVTLLAGVLGNLIAGKMPSALGLLMPRSGVFLRYRLTLLIGALLSFSALIPIHGIRDYPFSHGSARQRPKGDKKDYLLLAKFAWCQWWIGLGAGLVIPFFNLYFAKRFSASSGQIGFYFSVSQILTLLAVLAGPAVAGRIGRVRTVTLRELLSLPFLVTLGAENRLAVAVASFWMRASLMQMASPISSSFTMETVPGELRAMANSVTTIAWNLSWTISAAASGWMMQHYGYALPYYLTAGCYAVSAVSYYLMFRQYDIKGDSHSNPDTAVGRRDV
jgi:MFS family permease